MIKQALPYRGIPGLAFPLMALVIGAVVFAPKAFCFQSMDQEGGAKNHNVPVPGLGKNPWIVESFFKDLGVIDGGDAAIQDQLDSLKKLFENHKGTIEPGQRRLLENLLKDPGGAGGNAGLRDLARDLFSKANPLQQKLIREKINELGGAESANNFFSEVGKNSQRKTLSGINGNEASGGLFKMPKPPNMGGASNQKSIPPPFFDEGGKSQESPIGNSNLKESSESPRVQSKNESVSNPKVGDLSRMFSRILPFGLDQKISPIGKEFLQKIAGWSSNIQLPVGWKNQIQNALRDLNLPNNISPTQPTLASSPAIGSGFSGSKMLLAFIGVTGILILVVFLANRWNWVPNPNTSDDRNRISTSSSKSFVGALEGAVIRLGGDSQAFANHIKWKRDCGAKLIARGMGEELVGHLFDVYESAKYLGQDPGKEEESRLVEALNRHV